MWPDGQAKWSEVWLTLLITVFLIFEKINIFAKVISEEADKESFTPPILGHPIWFVRMAISPSVSHHSAANGCGGRKRGSWRF